MVRTLVLRPAAKINLTLRVGPARGDGYHDVRTLMQSVAVMDTLTITARRGPFTLQSSGAGVPTDDTNLVARAAAALWRALGREGVPRDAHVKLVKQIPIAAGLGGGSADAAAALVGLNTIWDGTTVAGAAGASRRDARLRRALLPAGRHRARDGPRRGGVSGRRCLALRRGDHQAVVWRGDGGCVPLARRGSRVASRPASRRPRATSISGGSVGPIALVNDLQAPGGPAASGDHGNHRRPRARRRAGRGHDGQRIGGFRPVCARPTRRAPPVACAGPTGWSSSRAPWPAARPAAASGCDKLPGLRTGPDALPCGSGARRVHAKFLGRGQAVRRGTLDPVFEGSNPSAPTNHRAIGLSG